MNINLESAYQEAEDFAQLHYENFPVISKFLPKKIRKHVAVVYKFARLADDLADEGKLSKDKRKRDLEEFEAKLVMAEKGEFEDDFWRALKNTIDEFKLSPKNFHNLLIAFNMDVSKNRFINFEEILNYCFYSANPVGRIILEFFGIRDKDSIEYSDAICTALQLTNFYQDVKIDFERNRIYIPQNEMIKFNVEERVFQLKEINDNFRQLLKYQIERTRELFVEGRKLIERLPYRLKYQIACTILGGEKILSKIEEIDYDVLNMRPVLSKVDYFILMLKSLMM